jgi:hypothetical protein
MPDSKPPQPPLRALIARVNERGRLATAIVPKEDVKTWVTWGWMYVATDPQDQEDLIQWYEQGWEI